MTMSSPRVTMNATAVVRRFMSIAEGKTRLGTLRERDVPGNRFMCVRKALARTLPRRTVGLQNVIQCPEGPALASREHRLNELWNVGEGDASRKETFHRHFVGRVENRRRTASGRERLVGERK